MSEVGRNEEVHELNLRNQCINQLNHLWKYGPIHETILHENYSYLTLQLHFTLLEGGLSSSCVCNLGVLGQN